MIELMEFAGASGAIKSAIDLVRSITDLTGGRASAEQLEKLRHQLSTAWDSVTATREAYSALHEKFTALQMEIAKLQNQIDNFETWTKEKARYELKTVSSFGNVAYAQKDGVEPDEPPHYLCANCYQRNKKSILQPTGMTELGRRVFLCHPCGARTPVDKQP